MGKVSDYDLVFVSLHECKWILKWCGMDWNGMFMPCPSGAVRLAIYLGSAEDTNQLPDTTLGKNNRKIHCSALGQNWETKIGEKIRKHMKEETYSVQPNINSATSVQINLQSLEDVKLSLKARYAQFKESLGRGGSR